MGDAAVLIDKDNMESLMTAESSLMPVDSMDPIDSGFSVNVGDDD